MVDYKELLMDLLIPTNLEIKLANKTQLKLSNMSNTFHLKII